MQNPLLVGRQVGKSEFRLIRSGKLPFAADRPQESERRLVGRQQEMIAVVDGQPKRRLEIRTAPSAGMTRELVHDDRATAVEASQRG